MFNIGNSLKEFKSLSTLERKQHIASLTDTEDSNLVPLLLGCLEDTDWEVRYYTVDCLVSEGFKVGHTDDVSVARLRGQGDGAQRDGAAQPRTGRGGWRSGFAKEGARCRAVPSCQAGRGRAGYHPLSRRGGGGKEGPSTAVQDRDGGPLRRGVGLYFDGSHHSFYGSHRRPHGRAR